MGGQIGGNKWERRGIYKFTAGSLQGQVGGLISGNGGGQIGGKKWERRGERSPSLSPPPQVQLKVCSEDHEMNDDTDAYTLLTKKVQVNEFGSYVEQLHANNNSHFREQFFVSGP